MLQLSFTGAPITALGGRFVPTQFDGTALTGRINLGFGDGSTWSSTGASLNGFVGFTSPFAITSLSINAPDNTCGDLTCFATLDDLYVGTARPAPALGTALLLATGLLGGLAFGVCGKRRRPASRRPHGVTCVTFRSKAVSVTP